MLSSLAKCDLEDLRANGLMPTDEDIIRLHALGCKITNGPETTAAAAPRFALVGGFVFWEPSLAAWEWFAFARKAVDSKFSDTVMLAFACSRPRVRGAFDGLYEPKTAEKEIKAFARSIYSTLDEISRAVLYVTTGNDDVIPEKTPLAKLRDAKRVGACEADRFAAIESLLSQAAAATGLTFDDIMLQTPSRLSSMIYAYYVQAGADLSKSSAQAQADYLCTLDAIRKRLEREREDEQGN